MVTFLLHIKWGMGKKKTFEYQIMAYFCITVLIQ